MMQLIPAEGANDLGLFDAITLKDMEDSRGNDGYHAKTWPDYDRGNDRKMVEKGRRSRQKR